MAVSSLGAASPSPESSNRGIRCTTVPGDERLNFLPRVFGPRLMMRGEAAVFNWMSELCREYRGGFWDFVDLSNGGFYMRLVTDKPLAIRVDGNGFDEAMSADAASIVASLFAINDLLFKGADHLHDAYYQLRDFAMEHPEGRQILQAID